MASFILIIGFTVATPASAYSQEIAEQIAIKAKALNLNPTVMIYVAVCESSLNPKAYNWDRGAEARGMWQITKKYHPQVTDEQAYDWEWATDWSLKRIKDGYYREWSCWPKGIMV